MRLATEQLPAGNSCDRVQRNVDIMESRGNGPQLSTRHEEEEEETFHTGAQLNYNSPMKTRRPMPYSVGR